MYLPGVGVGFGDATGFCFLIGVPGAGTKTINKTYCQNTIYQLLYNFPNFDPLDIVTNSISNSKEHINYMC